MTPFMNITNGTYCKSLFKAFCQLLSALFLVFIFSGLRQPRWSSKWTDMMIKYDLPVTEAVEKCAKSVCFLFRLVERQLTKKTWLTLGQEKHSPTCSLSLNALLVFLKCQQVHLMSWKVLQVRIRLFKLRPYPLLISLKARGLCGKEVKRFGIKGGTNHGRKMLSCGGN